MKYTFTSLVLLVTNFIQAQNMMQTIEKNQMIVSWEVQENQIYFEMQAPTQGWVTIGFNENESLSGAYLLMGRIKNGKAEVVEHYVKQPGDYQPILEYGIESQILSVNGLENETQTQLSFSIPIAAISQYHKNLFVGTQWTLIIAYSTEDDFQHHSIMRTSAKIQL